MALAPVSSNQVDYLFQRLLVARPAELLTIRTALDRHQDAVKERLWAVLADGYAGKEQRVRAGCALAAYDPDSGRWADVCRAVADGLAAEPALALGTGKDLLRPIRACWSIPCSRFFSTGNGRMRSERWRSPCWPTLPATVPTCWRSWTARPTTSNMRCCCPDCVRIKTSLLP